MAKNQNNNVAPATKKTGAEAKKDALATALAQIEKQFGKGAVMKLGPAAASLRCMARNPAVRPRWLCTFWPRPRRRAAT